MLIERTDPNCSDKDLVQICDLIFVKSTCIAETNKAMLIDAAEDMIKNNEVTTAVVISDGYKYYLYRSAENRDKPVDLIANNVLHHIVRKIG